MNIMERVLIIGATGRIGREVVRLLAERGPSLRALVRGPTRAGLGAGIEQVAGDLRDPEALRRAFTGVDHVVLITPDGLGQAALESAAMVAAARAGVRQIVKISACAAGAPEVSRFGEQHARAESALRASGVNWTVLRPNLFMQNFLDFAPMIAERGVFMAPLADARLSMIDARDVAAGACAVLGRAEQFGLTHALTGPASLRFADAATILSTELGVKVRYQPVPGALAGLAMLASMNWWQMRGVLEVFAFVRAGHEAEVTSTLQSLTGEAPRSFAEFVRDHRSSLLKRRAPV